MPWTPVARHRRGRRNLAQTSLIFVNSGPTPSPSRTTRAPLSPNPTSDLISLPSNPPGRFSMRQRPAISSFIHIPELNLPPGPESD